MTKRFGFTLAEVLITLGIIGVVAAMTMPTLINATQGAQYKAAYKKALSALSQAVTLNVALDEWNFADADGNTYTVANMLTNRMNVVRSETGDSNIKLADGTTTYSAAVTSGTNGSGVTGSSLTIDSNNTTLFFNDGIMFSFPTAAKECSMDATTGSTTPCYGFVDVNGIKAPNKVVKCDSGSKDTDCVITSPTDVYPVKFYDQTVLPASVAARAVLYSK